MPSNPTRTFNGVAHLIPAGYQHELNSDGKLSPSHPKFVERLIAAAKNHKTLCVFGELSPATQRILEDEGCAVSSTQLSGGPEGVNIFTVECPSPDSVVFPYGVAMPYYPEFPAAKRLAEMWVLEQQQNGNEVRI